MAAIDRVKDLLQALPREDQEELHRFLSGTLFVPLAAETRHVASLEDKAREVTYTFRTERVRCGKAGCACRDGPGHGPYVYKYWKEAGRLRKRYVGRAQPARREGAGSPRA